MGARATDPDNCQLTAVGSHGGIHSIMVGSKPPINNLFLINKKNNTGFLVYRHSLIATTYNCCSEHTRIILLKCLVTIMLYS